MPIQASAEILGLKAGKPAGVAFTSDAACHGSIAVAVAASLYILQTRRSREAAIVGFATLSGGNAAKPLVFRKAAKSKKAPIALSTMVCVWF
jgi:hypothetical protein